MAPSKLHSSRSFHWQLMPLDSGADLVFWRSLVRWDFYLQRFCQPTFCILDNKFCLWWLFTMEDEYLF